MGEGIRTVVREASHKNTLRQTAEEPLEPTFVVAAKGLNSKNRIA